MVPIFHKACDGYIFPKMIYCFVLPALNIHLTWLALTDVGRFGPDFSEHLLPIWNFFNVCFSPETANDGYCGKYVIKREKELFREGYNFLASFSFLMTPLLFFFFFSFIVTSI